MKCYLGYRNQVVRKQKTDITFNRYNLKIILEER